MSPTIDNRELDFRYTKEEKGLIDKHLQFYIDLDKGKRVPNTEKQKHFVCFCRGLEKANTPHEFAYLKYKRNEQPRRKQRGINPDKEFHSPQGAGNLPREIKAVVPSTEKNKLDREAYLAALERKKERDKQSGGIPEHEDGSLKSEWGTRQEHKKMRARDWGDMQKRRKE